MCEAYSILIVEDDPIIALALELAVLDEGWAVIGPFETVRDAMYAASTRGMSGAVLDGNLADGEVTPLALALYNIGVPFVMHSATMLPTDLAELSACAVPKPAHATAVISKLSVLMGAD